LDQDHRLAIARRAWLALAAGLAAGRPAAERSARAQEPARVPNLVPFTAEQPGGPPQGFTAALTGGGGSVNWQVLDEPAVEGGRILAQTSTDPTEARYPLCIYDAVSRADVGVTVRIKPVAGRVDRAGGIVLRVQDASTYYVVRANALENNVRFYRVVDGRRIQLAGANARIRMGAWQTLRVAAVGSRFSVWLDERQLFDAADATIRPAGRIGLWTKADSVTHFDRLQYA
jgi:hypothetical protein